MCMHAFRSSIDVRDSMFASNKEGFRGTAQKVPHGLVSLTSEIFQG